jgi:hypothetical protein
MNRTDTGSRTEENLHRWITENEAWLARLENEQVNEDRVWIRRLVTADLDRMTRLLATTRAASARQSLGLDQEAVQHDLVGNNGYVHAD